ncbi:MAG TPA: hypothetical protein VH815_01095 [Acidobacteriota bacterium]
MNIDRHNYEEYFLLYIDNELNVDQKKQVELFVQANPDLEEELVMLKQSRLIPDEFIVFDNKHLLMKEENAQHSANRSFINMNNYEQWLIMYVDDELNAEEKIAVEKFASAHQHVQQELELFQQTKLQPEEISFPDKENLYRRERPVRVVTMQWWKIAVAAVLIISAGITVYSVLINKSNNAGTTNNLTKTTVEKKQTPNEGSPTTQDKLQPNVIPDQRQEEQLTVVPTAKKQSDEKEKTQEQPEEENKQQLAFNEPTVNVADEQQRPATVGIDNAGIEEPRIKNDIVFDDKMPKETFNSGIVTNLPIETPHGGTPGGTITEPTGGTENKKFRGFFRKATRILERTTSINAADDDKVLIGGMAINLK